MEQLSTLLDRHSSHRRTSSLSALKTSTTYIQRTRTILNTFLWLQRPRSIAPRFPAQRRISVSPSVTNRLSSCCKKKTGQPHTTSASTWCAVTKNNWVLPCVGRRHLLPRAFTIVQWTQMENERSMTLLQTQSMRTSKVSALDHLHHAKQSLIFTVVWKRWCKDPPRSFHPDTLPPPCEKNVAALVRAWWKHVPAICARNVFCCNRNKTQSC